MSGTVPVSILGTNFAMAQHPFWKPDQYSTCILSIHLLLRRGRRAQQCNPRRQNSLGIAGAADPNSK